MTNDKGALGLLPGMARQGAALQQAGQGLAGWQNAHLGSHRPLPPRETMRVLLTLFLMASVQVSHGVCSLSHLPKSEMRTSQPSCSSPIGGSSLTHSDIYSLAIEYSNKVLFYFFNPEESPTSASPSILIRVMTQGSGRCQLCAVCLCVKMARTTPDWGQNHTVITVWRADR